MRTRTLLWLTLLIAVALFVSAAAWAWFGLLDGGEPLQRATIEGLTARDPEPPGTDAGRSGATGGDETDGRPDPHAEAALPELVNVLVAGSDSRVGIDDDSRVGGERPDTIMVVQVRLDGSDAALLSIPRDLRVERCDGSTGRINGVFAIASRLGIEGGSCLVRTVTDLTAIPIHHYVELDMAGFIDVVDTIGGVEMCFDQSKGRHGAAGCHTFDGSSALAFVRDRSLDGTGDFGRMERQQQFVRAVADEIADARSIAGLPRLARTLERLKASVTTDADLDVGTLRALAEALRDADGDAIVGATVPGDPRTLRGIAYVIMRDDEAEDIFAPFRDGRAHDHLREDEAALRIG